MKFSHWELISFDFFPFFCHLSLFLGVWSMRSKKNGFDNDLVLNRRQAIIQNYNDASATFICGIRDMSK